MGVLHHLAFFKRWALHVWADSAHVSAGVTSAQYQNLCNVLFVVSGNISACSLNPSLTRQCTDTQTRLFSLQSVSCLHWYTVVNGP